LNYECPNDNRIKMPLYKALCVAVKWQECSSCKINYMIILVQKTLFMIINCRYSCGHVNVIGAGHIGIQYDYYSSCFNFCGLPKHIFAGLCSFAPSERPNRIFPFVYYYCVTVVHKTAFSLLSGDPKT